MHPAFRIVAALLLILPSVVLAQKGGPIPLTNCTTAEDEWATIQLLEARARVQASPSMAPVLFADPMGAGGAQSFAKPIVSLVDHAGGPTTRDYQCGGVTYDFHRGTDIAILDFYEMDEGVPVLAAAPGVVVFKHDGEYDRQYQWQEVVTPNKVQIEHADGTLGSYLHFRRNSIRVSLDDTVAVGDTLGLVGSSGRSSGPHLHFEVISLAQVSLDPFEGDCWSSASRWIQQPDYTLDLPFELMHHSLTAFPLTWSSVLERPPYKRHFTVGSTVRSWLRCRSLQGSSGNPDTLRWDMHRPDGSLHDSNTTLIFEPSASSWWMSEFMTGSIDTSLHGDWEVRVFHNGVEVAVQPFVLDDVPNRAPLIPLRVFEVDPGSSLSGEFVGIDPDGAIARFDVVGFPRNGSLAVDGGGKRKFVYTPDPGFVGADTVTLEAADDEYVIGSPGIHVFHVGPQVAVGDPTPGPSLGMSVVPNPFFGSTRITVDAGPGETVRATIYDLRGRVLTRLQGPSGPGPVSVVWDGRDRSGRPAASGIYLVRATAGTVHATRKIVLTRAR